MKKRIALLLVFLILWTMVEPFTALSDDSIDIMPVVVPEILDEYEVQEATLPRLVVPEVQAQDASDKTVTEPVVEAVIEPAPEIVPEIVPSRSVGGVLLVLAQKNYANEPLRGYTVPGASITVALYDIKKAASKGTLSATAGADGAFSISLAGMSFMWDDWAEVTVACAAGQASKWVQLLEPAADAPAELRLTSTKYQAFYPGQQLCFDGTAEPYQRVLLSASAGNDYAPGMASAVAGSDGAWRIKLSAEAFDAYLGREITLHIHYEDRPDAQSFKATYVSDAPLTINSPVQRGGLVTGSANPYSSVELRFSWIKGTITVACGSDGTFSYPCPKSAQDGMIVTASAQNGSNRTERTATINGSVTATDISTLTLTSWPDGIVCANETLLMKGAREAGRGVCVDVQMGSTHLLGLAAEADGQTGWKLASAMDEEPFASLPDGELTLTLRYSGTDAPGPTAKFVKRTVAGLNVGASFTSGDALHGTAERGALVTVEISKTGDFETTIYESATRTTADGSFKFTGYPKSVNGCFIRFTAVDTYGNKGVAFAKFVSRGQQLRQISVSEWSTSLYQQGVTTTLRGTAEPMMTVCVTLSALQEGDYTVSTTADASGDWDIGGFRKELAKYNSHTTTITVHYPGYLKGPTKICEQAEWGEQTKLVTPRIFIIGSAISVETNAGAAVTFKVVLSGAQPSYQTVLAGSNGIATIACPSGAAAGDYIEVSAKSQGRTDNSRTVNFETSNAYYYNPITDVIWPPSGTIGRGTAVTVSGIGEPNRYVNLVASGLSASIAVGAARATADGNWSISFVADDEFEVFAGSNVTLSVSYADGSYKLSRAVRYKASVGIVMASTFSPADPIAGTTEAACSVALTIRNEYGVALTNFQSVVTARPDGGFSFGTISALKPGWHVEVMTKDGAGNSATAYATVSEVASASNITLLGERDIVLGVSDSYTIYYRIEPRGTTASATFSSSNESVASVSQSGVIKAAKRGTAVITVSVGNVTALVGVTVVTAPKTVSLAPRSAIVAVGATKKLTVKLASASKGIACALSSSKPGVASVDQDGTVTAHSQGTAIITVRTYNGKTASTRIVVKAPISSIKLNKTELTLDTKGKVRLSASYKKSEVGKLIYTTSDPRVATVKSDGAVAAKGAGVAIITARTEDPDGPRARCVVTVVNRLESIKLEVDHLKLGASEQIRINVLLTPSENVMSKLTFSSSNKALATVTQNGLVTAKHSGTAVISVKSYNGLVKKVIFRISRKPTGLRLKSFTLEPGQIKTVKPSFGTGQFSVCKFKSSNAQVATIDVNTGELMAIALGTTTITATALAGGIEASCEVTVAYPPEPEPEPESEPPDEPGAE